ncbi:MAG: peptidylprolyl isomerase [Cyclonatronaceae bacterium]
MEGRTIKAALLLAFSFLMFTSCSSVWNSADKDTAQTVAMVDGETVSWQELIQNYQRNPAEADSAEAIDIDELTGFLDLYVDYKAKLAAARDGGYFEDEAITSELRQYEMQSVYPYWMENKIKDELLHELMERSSEQIHASHILIRVDQDPTPGDTLNAWNKLMEARERFLAGEDFDELALEYSSSDRGRSMGGDIGFFSAGRTVKEFEDVAYNTPLNEVSMPFRTRFGYHMLYVKERRQKEPEKLFSHIYFEGDANVQVTLDRANDVVQRIKEGASWSEMVKEYSVDTSSIPRDGQIGWIQPGQYAARFDSTIMALKNPGDITTGFQSEYGVHIVKLDSIRTYQDDTQLRAELEDLLTNLPRYRNTKGTALQQVKTAGNARFHIETRDHISNTVTGTPGVSFDNLEWDEGFEAKPLFTIDGITYTVSDYFEWLGKRWEQEQTRIYRHSLADEFADAMAENHVLEITKREFPAFARLSEQYLDGLAVFKITEDSVWNYAAIDTAALERLYEEQPDRYQFERRYEFYRFSAAHDSVINKGIDKYNSGVAVDSLIGNIQGLTIRRDIITNLDEHPLTLLANLDEGEYTEPYTFRARRNLLLLKTIHEPRQMTFDEAYHRLVSDYQPVREQEWLQALRQRYSVKTYPEKLQKIASERL